MTHVITQPCCNDASCVAVCPVNCIHPAPDEPGYGTAEMLYIDAQSCIDCGACVDVCPVEAIVPDDELDDSVVRYLDLNKLHYVDHSYPSKAPPSKRVVPLVVQPLRVAIVGSGPAACYAAEDLMSRRGLEVEVTMFERLATPWGLVRFGVAPDHPGTKAVTAQFDRTASRRAATVYLNTEIGRHLSHDELLAHHDAVMYAVGASADRRLGVPGEDKSGSVSATDFVGWYNGHPDLVDLDVRLDCDRAVVMGNGNVALDIARILALDVDELRRTDIADHALDVLAASTISEVVVVGRRGPAQAAYTTPELLALGHLPRVEVIAEADEVSLDDVTRASLLAAPDPVVSYKAEVAREFASGSRMDEAARRILLRYRWAANEVLGADRVTGVRLDRTKLVLGESGAVTALTTGATEDLDCGLLVRAVGHRGRPVPGVPFDQLTGTIPHVDGRVVDEVTGEVLPGVYVAGWIKRGPSGVIGTNKKCAEDTVRALLADAAAGRLQAPPHGHEQLAALIAARQPRSVDYAGWRAIDRHESDLGRAQQRPRVKLLDLERMLEVAEKTDS